MIEQTRFMVKTEAFVRRDEIVSYLEKHSDLKVCIYRDIILSLDDIENIYLDDKDSELMFAIQEHLKNKMVRIGLIEGENAIQEFIFFCGESYNSSLCSEGTLRRVFGLENGKYYGSVFYYLNGIHKASSFEAPRAVKWFRDKFKGNDSF